MYIDMYIRTSWCNRCSPALRCESFFVYMHVKDLLHNVTYFESIMCNLLILKELLKSIWHDSFGINLNKSKEGCVVSSRCLFDWSCVSDRSAIYACLIDHVCLINQQSMLVWSIMCVWSISNLCFVWWAVPHFIDLEVLASCENLLVVAFLENVHF
jgi:hypothetical protein